MTSAESSGYRARFERLRQQVAGLQHQMQQANPEPMAVRSQFLTLQQQFQQEVMALDLADEPEAAQILPQQIEINKQMRLLGVDISFLQAARQAHTAQQRQAQILQRLQQILAYCDNVQRVS